MLSYREQGNNGQARYCLSKAITADPTDVSLLFHQASLHSNLGDYQKAAELFEQIQKICPEDVEALQTGAKVSSLSKIKDISHKINS